MNTINIKLFDKEGKANGIANIWESRPGKFSWSHPDGSEGCDYNSFEEAETALLNYNLDMFV